ncbi:MAG: RluA family pseudouridine synthase [Spirobacillus cienkowskii]|jgi:23S rRNA pseudouridine1911/1915/1917 synthase|uniref:Pseudouridine synthase n=1 Tax=Spirobacillus cienkowskii TaxID=495820 RepID=A0A369KRD8_9BACT|nr:MAG: RluA family pseudouridine synthase [Spirobacillus cienkowskii]
MDSITQLIVTDEFNSERLDVFITRVFDVIPSRSYSNKLILNKKVKVDNKFQKPSFRLKTNQIVEVDLSFVFDKEISPQAEDIPLNILFEDEHVIVIDKQAGMVVHPGAGVSSGTLVNALLNRCGCALPSLGSSARAGIVHRLDRDTSGVMVAAKTQLALTNLSKQFAEHKQIRKYHAIIFGQLQPLEGKIETWHGRDTKNRIKFSVQKEGRGKIAILNYITHEILRSGLFSLVECQLHTGRTHQIRVQLSYLNHGILGDALYSKIPPYIISDKKLFSLVSKNANRQMLHAVHLGFDHPITGEALNFNSSYPVDFFNMLNLIR